MCIRTVRSETHYFAAHDGFRESLTHPKPLTIEDAGKGMPDLIDIRRLIGRKSKPLLASGVGLASMRERLAQIGGRLKIDSIVGKMVVRAVIPLWHED